MSAPKIPRPRPLSPNIQIYRPQLTSVLSIGYRISGVALVVYAVGLVTWLIAIAAGPEANSAAQQFSGSWLGRVLLLGCTFSFFWHLCGGIRHLVWDTVLGFELRWIYISGWAMVVLSIVLTVATWTIGLFFVG
ncbi:MAG TPA: succinate dehydrogenase, cytochrome b556 subunit [Devosia sp.]|nr:succinate dehydrogenase, cytochrome b556 subunit [Devosia sp.]